MTTIAPHGGRLVNRIATGAERDKWLSQAGTLPKITLDAWQLSDVELIAIGAVSPLEGFMGQRDYQSVVESMRLASGLPWSMPITLSVSQDTAQGVKKGQDIALVDGAGALVAILHLAEVFLADKPREAQQVFRTTEIKHPGVARLMEAGEINLAGKITVINRPTNAKFQQYLLDPADARAKFEQLGWKRVVGFQTRNPIHRAHEYIQKTALEIVDGLFLHPLVGETKSDDVPAAVRMRCYEALLASYYPKDRVMLAINPASMRYAGPREAIFHALIRKNYGCTHFIVGRDHAGVGSYYGTFDAQQIFDEFQPEELGITPLMFDNTFYCKHCEGMASVKTCPHGEEERVSLSGTKLRALLQEGKLPPHEVSRPEVAEILIAAMAKDVKPV